MRDCISPSSSNIPVQKQSKSSEYQRKKPYRNFGRKPEESKCEEEFKEHSKKLTKMEEDRPKLYGILMKHMSMESKNEVAQDQDYETWHAEKVPEKLWQAIIKMHKVDCVSTVDTVKELMVRKAYQNIK